MSPYAAASQGDSRTDGLGSLPYTGLSALAVGFFGLGVLAPFALVSDPIAFSQHLNPTDFVFGFSLAGLADYTLSRLTDNGTRWPQLPRWVGSTRVMVVSILLHGTMSVGLYVFSPSWLPVVVIGGMHAFAVGTVVMISVGSIRSGVWAVRQAI